MKISYELISEIKHVFKSYFTHRRLIKQLGLDSLSRDGCVIGAYSKGIFFHVQDPKDSNKLSLALVLEIRKKTEETLFFTALVFEKHFLEKVQSFLKNEDVDFVIDTRYI